MKLLDIFITYLVASFLMGVFAYSEFSKVASISNFFLFQMDSFWFNFYPYTLWSLFKYTEDFYFPFFEKLGLEDDQMIMVIVTIQFLIYLFLVFQ